MRKNETHGIGVFGQQTAHRGIGFFTKWAFVIRIFYDGDEGVLGTAHGTPERILGSGDIVEILIDDRTKIVIRRRQRGQTFETKHFGVDRAHDFVLGDSVLKDDFVSVDKKGGGAFDAEFFTQRHVFADAIVDGWSVKIAGKSSRIKPELFGQPKRGLFVKRRIGGNLKQRLGHFPKPILKLCRRRRARARHRVRIGRQRIRLVHYGQIVSVHLKRMIEVFLINLA